MKRFILTCIGIVLTWSAASFAQAELFNSCGQYGSLCDPCKSVAGKKGGWFLNGHLETGLWANEYGTTNHYYPTTASQNVLDYGNGGDSWVGRPLQNVANSGLQLNQIYISAGKAVNGQHGLDIGGTVDFVFGTDAYMVQARGMEFDAGHGSGRWGSGDYFSAFAQAYAELEYKKWNIKAGKFYAPFGSQSFKSSDNFFYSFASDYSIVPKTAGGVYATYTVNDKLDVYAGWVQPDQFGETKNDNAFLFGVIWQPTRNLNIHYALGVGENHYDVDWDYFVNSLVVNWQISKKWKYVFDWSYFQTKTVGDTDLIYGFNNELIYTLNSKWAFGARFGMLRDGGVGAMGLSDNEDWYTIGLGANWSPTKWLVIKPEIRYDRFADGRPFGRFINGLDNFGHEHKDQFSGGVSMLVKF